MLAAVPKGSGGPVWHHTTAVSILCDPLYSLLSGEGARKQAPGVSIEGPNDVGRGNTLQIRDPIARDGNILGFVWLVLYWTLRARHGYRTTDIYRETDGGGRT